MEDRFKKTEYYFEEITDKDEINEDKFKEYVDSLNKFTKDEIKELKKFNIHNADKL